MNQKSFCFPAIGVIIAICSLSAPQSAVGQISIGTVAVGNAGNANDSTGYGGVGYDYSIGATEVTVGQYSAFLNAVAKTDTFNLYNGSMATDFTIAGITRSGASGSYVYSVLGSANKPVTYVNWFDAARFVNWVQNGQPIGAQAAGTTETGVYTLNGAVIGTGFARNSGVSYALPSENEWYKAAYHQPVGAGGDTDDYWLYPTAGNDVPNSRNGSLGDPNSANFFRDDGLANGFNGGFAVNNSTTTPSGNALTDGGAFGLSDSHYGTFDQGGGVWEWTEAVSGGSRIIRGGSWSGNESSLRSTVRNTFFSANESQIVGFRIVAVPEPGVIVLLALGATALLVFKRKRTA